MIKSLLSNPGLTTYRIPRAVLLLPKLRRLRHGQPNQLVLVSALRPSGREQLQRLHGGPGSQAVGVVLLALTAAAAVQRLVSADHVALVNVLVREAALVLLQEVQSLAEE